MKYTAAIFLLAHALSCDARSSHTNGAPFSISPLSRSLHLLPLHNDVSSSSTEGSTAIHLVNKDSAEEEHASTPESFDDASEEDVSVMHSLNVNGGSSTVVPRQGGANETESFTSQNTDQQSAGSSGSQQQAVDAVVSEELSNAVADTSFHPIHLDSHSGVNPHAVKKASKYAKKLKVRAGQSSVH
jgi:hypothetical protein